MKFVRFNNEIENNDLESPYCAILVSKNEAYKIIHNLLIQLEGKNIIEEFKSNDGKVFIYIENE